MEPLTAAEKARAASRANVQLIASRTVRTETRTNRDKLLKFFQDWPWATHEISLKELLSNKPSGPEEICKWLIQCGQELYLSYGTFSETINAVAAARPLVRKQLTPAWDLAFAAFAWLADEPHQHHPALPLSILLAMLSTCLLWGWPREAAVIALTWNGILRIGEVLLAHRRDLVLLGDAAPGIEFLVLQIQVPKTRGRAAKHQAATVDPVDMIQLISAVFRDLQPDQLLWPLSAATLRKRFVMLLKAVGIPEGFAGKRGFDLGSPPSRGGDTFVTADGRSGVMPQTWQMVVDTCDGDLPARSYGHHFCAAVGSIHPAAYFRACRCLPAAFGLCSEFSFYCHTTKCMAVSFPPWHLTFRSLECWG